MRRSAHLLLILVLGIGPPLALTGCALSSSPTLTTIGELQLLTDAKLLPPNWTVHGETHAKYLAPLTAWATHYGVCVHRSDHEGDLTRIGLLGQTVWHRSGWILVWVDADMPSNAQLATLFHELAHVFQPRTLTVPEAEVFAELVSIQACHRLGLNIRGQTARYLTQNVTDPQLVPRIARSRQIEIDWLVKLFEAAARGAAVDTPGLRTPIVCAP